MSASAGPSDGPLGGLDPDVIAFLDGAPIPGTTPVTSAEAGSADGSDKFRDGAPPPQVPGIAAADPADGSSDGVSPPPDEGFGRHHARASWGAAGTMLTVIVAAALLDPSGLAAPVAWTGANPAVEPWTWLQYVLLAPLIVVLLWWTSRTLLAAATPAAPRHWVLSRVWMLAVLAMMTAKLV